MTSSSGKQYLTRTAVQIHTCVCVCCIMSPVAEASCLWLRSVEQRELLLAEEEPLKNNERGRTTSEERKSGEEESCASGPAAETQSCPGLLLTTTLRLMKPSVKNNQKNACVKYVFILDPHRNITSIFAFSLLTYSFIRKYTLWLF